MATTGSARASSTPAARRGAGCARSSSAPASSTAERSLATGAEAFLQAPQLSEEPMNFRPVGALVLVLATAAGVPAAHAAVKPLCKIVTDETGDTFVARAQDGTKPGPQEDGFDITSADVASDGKVVTAVIRVKTLTSSVQTSPVGIGFSFDFLSPTSTMQASLRAVYVTGQAPYF